MSFEEFEKLISQNAHKSDILFLVDEQIQLEKMNQQESEMWYESCAELYILSEGKYADFKLNMSNRIDTFRYHLYLIRRDAALQKRIADEQFNCHVEVRKFAEQETQDYNNDTILNEVEKMIYEYSLYKLYYETRTEELQNSAQLVKLQQNLQADDFRLDPIKFTAVKTEYFQLQTLNKNQQKSSPREIKLHYFLESTLGKKLFIECFLNYFINRFVEKEYDLKELQKEINGCKETKKILLHKLIRDIYKVFIKHNKVDFKNPKDTYMFDETKNGLYPSLKKSISIWIYDLLVYLGYLQNVDDWEIKKDFIRNCMENKKVLSCNNCLPPKDWPYL